MIRKRTQSREYAVQMMYHFDMTEESVGKTKQAFWASMDSEGAEEADEQVRAFANDLFEKASAHMGESDELVRKYLKKGWTFERLGQVEKCLLRVGIEELFRGDAPVYAILDDYVTITRKFCDETSIPFINGILDTIRTEFNIERTDG